VDIQQGYSDGLATVYSPWWSVGIPDHCSGGKYDSVVYVIHHTAYTGGFKSASAVPDARNGCSGAVCLFHNHSAVRYQEVKEVINPQIAAVFVVVIILGGLIYVLDDKPEDVLVPGASINIDGSSMSVDLVELDMGPEKQLIGADVDIKRIEYRIDGGNWSVFVLDDLKSLWIPLNTNVTGLEIMALRGDTLVRYDVFGV